MLERLDVMHLTVYTIGCDSLSLYISAKTHVRAYLFLHFVHFCTLLAIGFPDKLGLLLLLALVMNVSIVDDL